MRVDPVPNPSYTLLLSRSLIVALVTYTREQRYMYRGIITPIPGKNSYVVIKLSGDYDHET